MFDFLSTWTGRNPVIIQWTIDIFKHIELEPQLVVNQSSSNDSGDAVALALVEV